MRRAWLLRLAAAVLIVLGVAFVGTATAQNLREIETWIHGLGLWGLLAYVGMFLLLTTFFVPDTLLALVAGAVFGMTWGVPVVVFAAILAAVVQYGLARTLLRERIDRVVASRRRLAAIQTAVRRDQVRLQWFLRLTPFNPTAVSYLLGATGVRFPSYLLACFGLVPALAVEVYVGHAGRSLVSAVERQKAAGPWHDVLMVAGLIACFLVLVYLARMARRAVREAVAQASADG